MVLESVGLRRCAQVGLALLVACLWQACGDTRGASERDAACGAACGADTSHEGGATGGSPSSSNGPQTGDSDAAASPNQSSDAAMSVDASRMPSTDPNDFFGEPRCASAGLALCDDFEADAIGAAPNADTWLVEGWGDGSAKVDDKHAARGKHAVHFHNAASGTKIVITQKKTFPAPQNRLFGRMFLYVEHIPKPFVWDDQSNFPLVHWTAASASGDYVENSTTYRPEVRAVGGINQRLLVNLDGGPKSEVGIDDEPPAGHESIVEGQWMCFEFEYSGTGEGAELRVWWDGIEHEHMHLVNTSANGATLWPIPTYDSMSFGWSHYQDYGAIMPAGFDVWIDAVAVDTQRIGCQL